MRLISRFRKWRANYRLDRFVKNLTPKWARAKQELESEPQKKKNRRLRNLIGLRVQIDETVRCNLPPVNIEPFGFSSVAEVDEEMSNLSSAEKLKVTREIEERQRDMESHIEREEEIRDKP